jgi:hypothetical protein
LIIADTEHNLNNYNCASGQIFGFSPRASPTTANIKKLLPIQLKILASNQKPFEASKAPAGKRLAITGLYQSPSYLQDFDIRAQVGTVK